MNDVRLLFFDRGIEPASGMLHSTGTFTTLHRAVGRRVTRHVQLNFKYGVAVGTRNAYAQFSGGSHCCRMHKGRSDRRRQ